MYCWGSTENGELGLGGSEVEQVLLPTFNNFGLTKIIKQIACGLIHTLFLTEDGQVYSCGNNEGGQLGHNNANRRPEYIHALEGLNIVQVAAGDQHSLALTSFGHIYSWGENGFGQLGIKPEDKNFFETPKMVKALARRQVIQLSCGSNHSLALSLDNEVYAWGLNSHGQLGIPEKSANCWQPQCVTFLNSVPIRLIKAGGNHSVALSQGGFLLTWGSNKYGQLGRPTEGFYNNPNFSFIPMVVPNLADYSEPLKYVAAGENHTAVLDSNGKIWTFGSGRYGQLGHGSFNDCSIPKPVLDLVGSRASQVACGRCHTLVYVPSQGQLYSFGQGMSGQLGVKSPQNRSLPHTVIGPWSAPSGRSVSSIDESSGDQNESIFYVKNVFAGGDTSFVCVSEENKHGPDFCEACPYQQPGCIDVAKINAMVSLEEEERIDDNLFTYCETILGSLGCWNNSFIRKGTSRVDHCLDYFLAEDCMNKLGRVSKDALREIAQNGIEKAISNLPTTSYTPECLRAYVLLPLWRGFLDSKNALTLHMPFARSFISLDTVATITYSRWLISLPIDYLRKLVGHYKRAVAHIILSLKGDNGCKLLTRTVEEEKCFMLSSLKMLDFLFKANRNISQKKPRLAYEEFYISEISENVDISQDFVNWFHSRSCYARNSPILFCEYSFLFDSKAKTLLLRADMTLQMQRAIQASARHTNPLFMLINPSEFHFLNLRVRRDNLVHDTLSQIDKLSQMETVDFHQFRKPLKVQFIGEEAEDEGGVRKEFFLLVVKELLNPNYGMFKEHEETRCIWFTEAALELSQMYYLIGLVCGLAIYNFTIINLPFPLALYKKLLDEAVDLDDYADLEPTITKNMKNMLEYDESNFEDIFCLNFTITRVCFGETKIIPLKPQGEHIPVTLHNKQEYVDLYMDWCLNRGIEEQYRAFHNGFHKVCGGGALKLFQPIELMSLVTGNENYDWQEFKDITIYKGEYYKDHPTILLFWEAFDELSQEQKKKFLLFLTGCDRIPILGMSVIKMIIQSTSDTNFLPVAHTCIIQLDLPKYGTKEKLKYKLAQAIQQCEVFALV